MKKLYSYWMMLCSIGLLASEQTDNKRSQNTSIVNTAKLSVKSGVRRTREQRDAEDRATLIEQAMKGLDNTSQEELVIASCKKAPKPSKLAEKSTTQTIENEQGGTCTEVTYPDGVMSRWYRGPGWKNSIKTVVERPGLRPTAILNDPVQQAALLRFKNQQERENRLLRGSRRSLDSDKQP